MFQAFFAGAFMIFIAAFLAYYDPRVQPETERGKNIKTVCKIILMITVVFLFFYALWASEVIPTIKDSFDVFRSIF